MYVCMPERIDLTYPIHHPSCLVLSQLHIIIITIIVIIIICPGGFPLHFSEPVGEGLAAAVGAVPGPVPALPQTHHRATQARRLGEIPTQGDAMQLMIIIMVDTAP